MEKEDFLHQIEDGLKELSQKDVVRFAGICALRALPFLGLDKKFSYWKRKDRQRYLYAVFCAIDINLCYNFSSASSLKLPSNIKKMLNHNSSLYSSCINSVISTATGAASIARSYSKFDTTSVALIAGSVTYIYDIVNMTKVNYSNTFKQILLHDLRNIHDGVFISSTDMRIYGYVWTDFRAALKSIGCAYWGDMYERLFANGFVPDPEELSLRMNVANAIREQGARAVANEVERMLREGSRHLNEARIIIIGEKGAGKTCIARRLIDQDAAMTEPSESTEGVETMLWKLNDGKTNVHIWDFAGHVVTHAAHRFFFSERCLYILVYNGRTDNQVQLQYWLDHVRNYGGDSPVYILVNLFDPHCPDIPENRLCREYAIAGIHTFSIKDNADALQTFRQDVDSYITKNPSWNNQQVAATHYRVKEALEELFWSNIDRIPIGRFNTIAQEHGYTGEKDRKELLKSLHWLGVGLWYNQIPSCRELVLNPEWISYGVYRVINHTSNKKSYAIRLEEFAEVFKGDSRYQEEHHRFIFDLMKGYELAYESTESSSLVIPHLLPEDEPLSLPAFPVGDSLAMRYIAEQPLPPDTISRFIVQHHGEIKHGEMKDVVWRRGVILEDGKGNIAMVMEKDRTIELSIKGGDKRGYFIKLRNTLDNIFDSYKSKYPDRQYRYATYGENTQWLDANTIAAHAQTRTPYYNIYTHTYEDLQPVCNKYDIHIDTFQVRNMHTGNGNITDRSVAINFHDCNIRMQGCLNELIDSLKKNGNTEEAQELEEVRDALEGIEDYTEPDKIRKSGAFSKLRRIVENILWNENSKLYKLVRGVPGMARIAEFLGKTWDSLLAFVEKVRPVADVVKDIPSGT